MKLSLPPGMPSWLKQRNTELAKLSSFITSLPRECVIVMGDFNTTPWSQAISHFGRTTGLKNVAKGSGVFPTVGNGWIGVHVNHMFVPPGSQI